MACIGFRFYIPLDNLVVTSKTSCEIFWVDAQALLQSIITPWSCDHGKELCEHVEHFLMQGYFCHFKVTCNCNNYLWNTAVAYAGSNGVTGELQSYQLVLYGVSVDPFDKNRPELPDEISCHQTCAASTDSNLACFGSGPDQCKKCKSELYQVEDTK